MKLFTFLKRRCFRNHRAAVEAPTTLTTFPFDPEQSVSKKLSDVDPTVQAQETPGSVREALSKARMESIASIKELTSKAREESLASVKAQLSTSNETFRRSMVANTANIIDAYKQIRKTASSEPNEHVRSRLMTYADKQLIQGICWLIDVNEQFTTIITHEKSKLI